MTRPKYFVVTDIEGVAGIDSFDVTRADDETVKAPAMDQLGREVNAAVAGIRSVRPDAHVDVWDGHGNGGLRASDVTDATYCTEGKPYFDLDGYDAMLFVGQHAMAGTIQAPLCHTYSSRHVASYRLNGVFIGEFGARALVAGRQGLPTVYLSGDDKAAREAEQFVPEIVTTVVKRGDGIENASHMDQQAACTAIRTDVAQAVDRATEIDPFDALEPPYTLEIRYRESVDDDTVRAHSDGGDVEVTRIDARTVQLESTALDSLPL
ncbi:M55 family metallopeptidase [Haloarchaeobius sp. TZWSO28]|uniref:M55 family metallopeptidase n=1 Tax=Haloarchaeobius sp. TZWSO28 TaxID=3446119 RepID=UPI003EB96CB4